MNEIISQSQKCNGPRSIPISKEFALPPLMITGLPLCAQAACVQGAHNPVNPHRQRLLVASHKSAKLKKAEPKGKAKAKPRAPANDSSGTKDGIESTSADAAAQSGDMPQEPAPEPPARHTEKKAPKKKNPESLYMTKKKEFLAQFLGRRRQTVYVIVGCMYLVCPMVLITHLDSSGCPTYQSRKGRTGGVCI